MCNLHCKPILRFNCLEIAEEIYCNIIRNHQQVQIRSVGPLETNIFFGLAKQNEALAEQQLDPL